MPCPRPRRPRCPIDNIDRAVKRGAGLTGEVVDYTEIIYEARGPQGSALLIECLTDNKNRAASEVRLGITRNGGTVADPGSVAYLFTRKGVVGLPKNDLTEDDLLMAVLDAGADEVKESGDTFEILSDPTDLRAVVAALEEAGIEYETDEVEFVPSMQVELDAEAARKFLKLVDALEELDDVQNVYSNADISAEVIAQTRRGLSTAVALRVLGVDPGLTRCGLGVVDVEPNRRATLVDVAVVGTAPGTAAGRAAAGHRRRHRCVAGSAQARRRGPRAGLQPAQRQHRHGHRPGLRRGDRCRRPPRHPGGAAHPHRGQGRGHRDRRSANKDSRGQDGRQDPAPGRAAHARRRRRRRWPWPSPTAGAVRHSAPPVQPASASGPRPAGGPRGSTPAQRAWIAAEAKARAVKLA